MDLPAKDPLKGPWILYSTKEFALQIAQMRGIGRIRPAITEVNCFRIFPSMVVDAGELLLELLALVEDETLFLQKRGRYSVSEGRSVN